MTLTPPSVRQLIDQFLACKRIAVVGVSRNPRSFNAVLFREFSRRGYDAIPVNPNAAEIEGIRCFARVQDIQPPAEAALLLTTPQVTEQVVRDCAEAGVRLLWMFRPSPAALEFCRNHGIGAVAGFCPLIFLPDAAWFHRFHGWLLKIAGRYPR